MTCRGEEGGKVLREAKREREREEGKWRRPTSTVKTGIFIFLARRQFRAKFLLELLRDRKRAERVAKRGTMVREEREAVKEKVERWVSF